MKTKFLIQKNKKKLIVFIAGALALPHHYEHLDSNDYDVLMLYAFDFKNDLPNLSPYKEIVLIAHSMGVMLADFLNIKALKMIFINGTPQGVDKEKGIHPGIFLKNIKHFDEDRFKKALFGENLSKASKFYLRKDAKNELDFLYKTAINKPDLSEFRGYFAPYLAIISSEDKVFPPKACLKVYDKIKMIKSEHFVFFDFKTWDELCIM